MSHQAQRDYFAGLAAKYPTYFERVKVLDCGSLDVNGSLRPLFVDCEYVGLDFRAGKNVDLVSKVHIAPLADGSFDTVVSAEMLEHDEHWADSLLRMHALLRPGGLLAISCAGPTRKEHGTRKHGGKNGLYGTGPDYYRNLTPAMICSVLGAGSGTAFSTFEAGGTPDGRDTHFAGFKR